MCTYDVLWYDLVMSDFPLFGMVPKQFCPFVEGFVCFEEQI